MHIVTGTLCVLVGLAAFNATINRSLTGEPTNPAADLGQVILESLLIAGGILLLCR